MPEEIKRYPLVGVGVMILKEGKVLLGKRKGSHGEGEYSFPGGHLEYMKTIEECARRETLEETGIEIKNIKFQFLANVRKYKPKHYLHVGVIAEWKEGEPELKEPDRCEGWGWYNLDNLPEPLFLMTKLAIISWKGKKIYFNGEDL